MHLDKPLISVIMPAYNAEKYIKEAIESILNQIYTNLELLICDDGSSDNTRNIINAFAEKDQRIKVFHNQSNCGNIVTCNKLFKLAKGTYIAIQDADDWSHPDRILLQLEKMKRDNLLVCGTQCFNSTENGQMYSQTNYPSDYTTILKSTPGNFPVVCASIMIHKEVYNAIGGYESYFNRLGGADLYWFSKIIEKYEFENTNLPLYYYRRTRESFSRTIKSEKQLIIVDIIAYLVEQRRNIGMDDLERKDFVNLENKINSLLSDRRFISEKYRKQAVHAVDQGNLMLGYNNIVKSLQKMPNHFITYRSLAYLIKKIFKEDFLKRSGFSRKEL